MDWEERTIPAVDTYRLTYAYNLSGELTNLTGPSQFGSIGVGYTYDKTGRPSTVTGANYGGVSSYASNIKYRAWSGLKSMSYGDGKALSTTYDTRMRATKWDVAGVMGWNYAYNYFNENTGRVTYAQNLYDATLDRSYDYDNVGRLIEAHTGSEARGALVGQGGAQDGPYSHSYRYDPQGNMWYRVGWGGSFNPWLEQWPQFTNNRLTTNPWTGAAMTYDAAGNLTNDGYQTYTYDATGQQASASAGVLTQSYDGDGLRVKKTESGVTTYYLRSTVLGGQVVNEIDQSGGLGRGYVYLGGQMLAIQNGGSVNWVHQDPVTKSQRLTNSSGAVTSTVDLDPWGGESSRSSNAAFQPHRYTTYERDANGGDEAMMRRYTAKWHRFDQPDPYDGSYDLTNPQSFNRYAYVQNDPVNFVDPTGLVTYDGWGLGTCDASGGYHLSFDGIEYGYWPDGGGFCSAGGGGRPADGGGGGGGGHEFNHHPKPKPTPKPCDVQAPSDPNDRAVAETLMGEATAAGSPQYGDNQRGGAAVGHASRGIVPRGAVRLEEFLMVSVIENRGRATGQSWFDVVNSKQANGNFQFEGYPNGQNNINQLGSEGSDMCERLRGALDSINAVKLNGPNNRFGTFMNWRGVDQHSFIRARQGAFRIAGTDFF